MHKVHSGLHAKHSCLHLWQMCESLCPACLIMTHKALPVSGRDARAHDKQAEDENGLKLMPLTFKPLWYEFAQCWQSLSGLYESLCISDIKEFQFKISIDINKQRLVCRWRGTVAIEKVRGKRNQIRLQRFIARRRQKFHTAGLMSYQNQKAMHCSENELLTYVPVQHSFRRKQQSNYWVWKWCVETPTSFRLVRGWERAFYFAV